MKNLILVILIFGFIPLSGQSNFVRDDGYYFPDTHSLTTGPDRDEMYLDLRSGFADNFEITIDPNNIKFDFEYWGTEYTYEAIHYRLDFNNNGTWETNWLNGTQILSYSFPQPDAVFLFENIRIEVEYRNFQISDTKLVTFIFKAETYPQVDAIYHDQYGNSFIKKTTYQSGSNTPVLVVEGFDPLNQNPPFVYMDMMREFIN